VSHIATALAKSKGRNVKPPPTSTLEDVPLARVGPVENPFLQTVATKKVDPVIYAAPPAARKFPVKKVVLGVSVVALCALAVAGWMMLGADNPLADLFPQLKPEPVAIHEPVKKTKASSAKPAFASAEGPSDHMRDLVRNLKVTSVAGGSIQRLTIGGKVFQPGETIAESLVLQAIETEEIVFRDASGHLYTRRH
jgi:hypothetical protein